MTHRIAPLTERARRKKTRLARSRWQALPGTANTVGGRSCLSSSQCACGSSHGYHRRPFDTWAELSIDHIYYMYFVTHGRGNVQFGTKGRYATSSFLGGTHSAGSDAQSGQINTRPKSSHLFIPRRRRMPWQRDTPHIKTPRPPNAGSSKVAISPSSLRRVALPIYHRQRWTLIWTVKWTASVVASSKSVWRDAHPT